MSEKEVCTDILSNLGSGRGKIILMVDDDVDLLSAIKRLLTEDGFAVITADNGKKGLGYLEKIQPDLIILDIKMPVMSGLAFLREISGDDGKPRYPVLILTARTALDDFFAGIAVAGFISKPCGPGVLLDEIHRILGSAGTGSDSVKRKALLVEDDAHVAEKVMRTFEYAGRSIERVDRAGDVMDAVISRKPGIVLIKRILPGMNGELIASDMAELTSTRNIPVIIYEEGGNSESGHRITMHHSNVRKYLLNNAPSALLQAVEDIESGRRG